MPRLSAKGSGDDVSIAAILDLDLLPELDIVKEFDREKEKARIEENARKEAEKNEAEKRRVEEEHAKFQRANQQKTAQPSKYRHTCKFCTECGARLAYGVKFCSECGTRVAPKIDKPEQENDGIKLIDICQQHMEKKEDETEECEKYSTNGIEDSNDQIEKNAECEIILTEENSTVQIENEYIAFEE